MPNVENVKNDPAMLYALMEVTKERYVLISAQELAQFDEYLKAAHNNDQDITVDLESSDHEPFQLVYGALIYRDISNEDLKKNIEDLKGCAMIDLNGNDFGQLIASSYTDICLFGEENKDNGSIPFVALMQTKNKEHDHISITMFPYYGMMIWESMINRPFLLACRKFVKIDGLTLSNWRHYIDKKILDEAYQNATFYTGPREAEEV